MGHSAPPVPTETTPAYHLYEPDVPAGPVVVSVPHAGRAYDEALLAQARVRRDVLQRLEDRWVDRLAYPLVERSVPVLVAQVPRAMIDLNRHEREIDAGMVSGIPRDVPLQSVSGEPLHCHFAAGHRGQSPEVTGAGSVRFNRELAGAISLLAGDGEPREAG